MVHAAVIASSVVAGVGTAAVFEYSVFRPWRERNWPNGVVEGARMEWQGLKRSVQEGVDEIRREFHNQRAVPVHATATEHPTGDPGDNGVHRSPAETHEVQHHHHTTLRRRTIPSNFEENLMLNPLVQENQCAKERTTSVANTPTEIKPLRSSFDTDPSNVSSYSVINEDSSGNFLPEKTLPTGSFSPKFSPERTLHDELDAGARAISTKMSTNLTDNSQKDSTSSTDFGFEGTSGLIEESESNSEFTIADDRGGSGWITLSHTPSVSEASEEED